MSGGAQAVRDLTAETFDEALALPAPLLVDFWSEFCSPCHEVGRNVEALAAELGDRLVVGKVDVQAQPELAARFQVASVPTLMIFVGGEPVRRLTGARPKSQIAREVAAVLG